ncbi:hypothetical protein J6590_105785 [Homalodisca vitripennis]|nr:hypothetical protein J6590_105785 [Homalodisca vitripennis]
MAARRSSSLTSDSGKLCGAAAVSPSPLLTASPTPYHTTPLSRFSGPVWNLSKYKWSVSACHSLLHNMLVSCQVLRSRCDTGNYLD